jgi:hypothetical protein
MLTFFTIPKPFRAPHICTIQRNAIGSWTRLPGARVFLCGNDDGVAQVARELGVVHIPDVETNEFGTPLLDSVFAAVTATATTELVCYANADIIFTDDLIAATARMNAPQFLMVGRRWNMAIVDPIDFSQPDWQLALRTRVRAEGVRFGASGIDYFVFRRVGGGFDQLPPFAVGRPQWDNWMIYHARMSRIPVIDASDDVMAIHQNHDYAHVPQARGKQWDGPEADRNRQLGGGTSRAFKITDATHVLRNGKLLPANDPVHKVRRWEVMHITHPRLWPWARFAWKWWRRVVRILTLGLVVPSPTPGGRNVHD